MDAWFDIHKLISGQSSAIKKTLTYRVAAKS
jgi:hypothetical protein